MIKVGDRTTIIKGSDTDIMADLCSLYDAIYCSLGKDKLELFIKTSLEVFKETKNTEHLKNLFNESFEKEIPEKLIKLI